MLCKGLAFRVEQDVNKSGRACSPDCSASLSSDLCLVQFEKWLANKKARVGIFRIEYNNLDTKRVNRSEKRIWISGIQAETRAQIC